MLAKEYGDFFLPERSSVESGEARVELNLVVDFAKKS